MQSNRNTERLNAREREILALARFRVRRLGDRVREIASWDAGYTLRKAAREADRRTS